MEEKKGSLPIGFSMSLAQDREAMQHFALLDETQQQQIIDYIQNAKEGTAKERIIDIIHKLHNQMIG